MADEAPDGAARAPVTVLGVGERLRSARRAKAFSLQQVAEVLRLDEPAIVALEEGRFDALGAPVFVRGHLKRYAELLGMPADVVLDAYRAAAPDSDAPPDISRQRPRPEGVTVPAWGRWAAALVVIAVLLATINANLRDESGPEQEQAAVAPAPVPAPVEAPAAAVPDAATVPASVKLGVSVSADAWVVIDDADRRVLYGLQLRDSRQEFDVRPPVRISTTNAPAVQLTIDGQPLPIPADRIVNKEAEFEWSPAPPAAPAGGAEAAAPGAAGAQVPAAGQGTAP